MYAKVSETNIDGKACGTLCYVKLNKNHYLSSEVLYFGIPETRHELTDEGKEYVKQEVSKHHKIEWNWYVMWIVPNIPSCPIY